MSATVTEISKTKPLTKAEARKVFLSSAGNAAKVVYADAQREGERFGRSVARKTLKSEFADMTPDQIVDSLLNV